MRPVKTFQVKNLAPANQKPPKRACFRRLRRTKRPKLIFRSDTCPHHICWDNAQCTWSINPCGVHMTPCLNIKTPNHLMINVPHPHLVFWLRGSNPMLPIVLPLLPPLALRLLIVLFLLLSLSLLLLLL